MATSGPAEAAAAPAPPDGAAAAAPAPAPPAPAAAASADGDRERWNTEATLDTQTAADGNDGIGITVEDTVRRWFRFVGSGDPTQHGDKNYAAVVRHVHHAADELPNGEFALSLTSGLVTDKTLHGRLFFAPCYRDGTRVTLDDGKVGTVVGLDADGRYRVTIDHGGGTVVKGLGCWDHALAETFAVGPNTVVWDGRAWGPHDGTTTLNAANHAIAVLALPEYDAAVTEYLF
mmetsp:Transcript_22502/g.58760  ORF Transcript_22502/g.58760 Transcript_22502/m.58760 type:complete len:232 (+) Transcript_22502:130-825(+)